MKYAYIDWCMEGGTYISNIDLDIKLKMYK